MQMIEVKAADLADLAGLALDWAVAKVEGISTHKFQEKTFALFGSLAIPLGDAENGYTPSSCWHCGGPLIQQHRISVTGPGHHAGIWSAHMLGSNFMVASHGATALEAACRRLVVEHLGDVVSVPAELVIQ